MLRARVALLRPLFAPPDPASRTGYSPGGLAQCDLWFPPVDVPLGFGQAGRPPVLVMVAGHSRVMTAVMLPSRQAPDLIAGHWPLLHGWGAVPKALVWDNESAVGSWRAGRPKLTAEFEAFRGMLGIRVIQCRPRDPESKGLVERANGYLETSFLPGPVVRLAGGLQHPAAGVVGPGQRPPAPRRWGAGRSTGGTPTGRRCSRCRRSRRSLGWSASVRLPRDYYVRLDSNDYSVHPSVIGRRVEVRADCETVTVTCAGRVVASHARCWARRQSITDPEHRAAAEVLRDRATRPPRRVGRGRPAAAADRLRRVLRPDRGRRLMAATAKAAGAGSGGRGRVPDPGVEGADDARRRHPAGRAGPGRVLVA